MVDNLTTVIDVIGGQLMK